MIKKFLLALIFCCGTAFAQQKEPTPVRLFQGDSLPTPPRQNAPWPHEGDALSNAAATLFEQGLADPRGLEYSEIEIAVGNPWNGGGSPLKTHGWVFPADEEEGRFAVAWNGLVYPVARVGAAVDLHKDWSPDSKMPQADNWDFNDASESLFVSSPYPNALKMVLLARLGETETANKIFTAARPAGTADPYLSLARDWAWNAFERAVCAHERGDDRLALADAQMLSKIAPLIEVEARRRGFKPDSDNSNSRFPDRKLPYLPFLKQLPSLLADCERRVANQKNPPLLKKDVAALIDDLQNVDARQWGQPGGVSLAGDARVAAIVQKGNAAVEPLLDAMENDARLTRSVSFGRDFFRSRHLISVSEAAYAALVDLLKVGFKTYGENGEPLSRKEVAAQVRAYWTKMGNLSPAERFYTTLQDDKAGKDQWLQAAANIVQPTDVESNGRWITVPDRKPGEKITLRGEVLRDGRAPSVAQLLAQRSDDIAAIRTGSTRDHFLFVDAGQMAIYLADWDKAAAIPILKKRLARAWSIGAQLNDILAFNGNPVEHFGGIISQMTLARARCGDETAYDEYAAWIQKADLKGVSFRGEELQKPLVAGAARPSIGRAIEYLFNDPKSPWSNILGEGNGSWLTDFWQTPLPQTAGFRKQAFRALADKSLAGAITFRPRKNGNSEMESNTQFTETNIQISGLGFGNRGSNGDPDTPPPGEKRAFRVCDAYAYFYSQYQSGPKFQLFWPEKKRDAGIIACRKWLELKNSPNAGKSSSNAPNQ